jgi:hypothetical protein
MVMLAAGILSGLPETDDSPTVVSYADVGRYNERLGRLTLEKNLLQEPNCFVYDGHSR